MAPFYVFPCGHAFHANCLIGHVTRCSSQTHVSLSAIFQLLVVFNNTTGLHLVSYTNHLWMSLLCPRLREYWTFRNGLAWWIEKQQKTMEQMLMVNLLWAQPQLTRSVISELSILHHAASLLMRSIIVFTAKVTVGWCCSKRVPFLRRPDDQGDFTAIHSPRRVRWKGIMGN